MTNAKDLLFFGQMVGKLIRGEDLDREEARVCWAQIINNEQPDLQQGAFMAALAQKGETYEEIVGSWEAIYKMDTNKVDLKGKDQVVENCGTGMDSLKTFNISTAAALIASSRGICIARHGARAITSKCGTVDVVEELGVDVECDQDLVRDSITRENIGIFNGMSPKVHPTALGRILSQIRFGTTLNIAGSLASPVRATHGVRGVYSPDIVENVCLVMQEIGYHRALVFYGYNSDKSSGMDELSNLGESKVCELGSSGQIKSYTITPEDIGIKRARYEEIATSGNRSEDAAVLLKLISGSLEGPKLDVVCMNAAAIFYLTGQCADLKQGVEMARETVAGGGALDKLRKWVAVQNRDPGEGEKKLKNLLKQVA